MVRRPQPDDWCSPSGWPGGDHGRSSGGHHRLYGEACDESKQSFSPTTACDTYNHAACAAASSALTGRKPAAVHHIGRVRRQRLYGVESRDSSTARVYGPPKMRHGVACTVDSHRSRHLHEHADRFHCNDGVLCNGTEV
jgi:hypothetical protein